MNYDCVQVLEEFLIESSSSLLLLPAHDTNVHERCDQPVLVIRLSYLFQCYQCVHQTLALLGCPGHPLTKEHLRFPESVIFSCHITWNVN